MKKILLSALTTAVVLVSNANAQGITPYGELKFGLSIVAADLKYEDNKVDNNENVFAPAIAFGLKKDFDVLALRVELEAHHNNDADDAHYNKMLRTRVKTDAYMINGYVDIKTGTPVTAYIGGGVGISHVKGVIKLYDPDYNLLYENSKSDTGFVWQAGGGLTYNLREGLDISVGYRYYDHGDFKKKGVKVDTTVNEFYLGIRQSF